MLLISSKKLTVKGGIQLYNKLIAIMDSIDLLDKQTTSKKMERSNLFEHYDNSLKELYSEILTKEQRKSIEYLFKKLEENNESPCSCSAEKRKLVYMYIFTKFYEIIENNNSAWIRRENPHYRPDSVSISK